MPAGRRPSVYISPALRRDPTLAQLATSLIGAGHATPENATDRAVDLLSRLWALGLEYADANGRLTLSRDVVALLLEQPDVAAVIPSQWLRVEGETLTLPDFWKKNGPRGRRRLRDRERKRKQRASSGNARRIPADIPADKTADISADIPADKAGAALARAALTPNSEHPSEPERKTPGSREDVPRPSRARTPAREAPQQSRPIRIGEAQPFDRLCSIYPHRPGPQWRDKALEAARAKLRQGHTWSQFLAGAERYARWCEATEQQPEYRISLWRFIADGLFLDPFELPRRQSLSELLRQREAQQQ
jgi:hypothetical protein